MAPAPVCSKFLLFIYFLLTFCHRGLAARESRRPRRHRRTSTSCCRRSSTWHGRRRRWLPRPSVFHANHSNFGDAPQLRLRHRAELFWAKKEKKTKNTVSVKPSEAITFNRHFRSRRRFSGQNRFHSFSKGDGRHLVFDAQRPEVGDFASRILLHSYDSTNWGATLNMIRSTWYVSIGYDTDNFDVLCQNATL